jgi:hypothetical protein
VPIIFLDYRFRDSCTNRHATTTRTLGINTPSQTQQDSKGASPEETEFVKLAARSVSLELPEIHEKFVFVKLPSRKDALPMRPTLSSQTAN